MALQACTFIRRGDSTIKSWIFQEVITLNMEEEWECLAMVLDQELKD